MAVMTDDQAHALIGELAQILVGYEPVTYSELVGAAKEAVNIVKNYRCASNIDRFRTQIRELSELLDDTEYGCYDGDPPADSGEAK
jgi:hypothetical protein